MFSKLVFSQTIVRISPIWCSFKNSYRKFIYLSFASTFSILCLKIRKLRKFSCFLSRSLLGQNFYFPCSLKIASFFPLLSQLFIRNNFFNGIFIMIRYFWHYCLTYLQIGSNKKFLKSFCSPFKIKLNYSLTICSEKMKKQWLFRCHPLSNLNPG